MKIYIDLAKQAITNTTDEKVYEGDFYSNVFEVLFYNYEDENWFPTMSQLAPNGRKAGDFTADALGVGESHTYVEDGKTYLRFTFTMGATWVLMKGKSNFYIWVNRLNGTVLKKCVGMVNVMIDQSTDNYFIADVTFNPNVKAYIDKRIDDLDGLEPSGVATSTTILDFTEDKGIWVGSNDGHWYYWNGEGYADGGAYIAGCSYTKNITTEFELQNRYLDKANGNANPDANSRCTDYIDTSEYPGGVFVTGWAQYSTCLIATYDENKTFIRTYGDGDSDGEQFTDYHYIPQSDEKYVKFSTYLYASHPLAIKKTAYYNFVKSNELLGKKYVACGDSFTKGDVIASNKVYPYLIAERNDMYLVNMSANGSYIHNGADGFTNSAKTYYYQNIPADADFITIAYGLNEISTTKGDKTSNDNTTIWGAWNEVLGWLTQNRPHAKIGIISNDAWMTYEFRNLLQEIASYWGVSFLDLKEYGKPMLISGKYSEDGDVNSTAQSRRTTQYCVSAQNGHPNEEGHLVRSWIIEDFLKGMASSDNKYTKKEVDTKLATKQDNLTFDNSPTENSNNPVKSGGIYTALGLKANASTTYSKTETDSAIATAVSNCKGYTDAKLEALKWELGSHTLDVTNDTDAKYLKSVPNYTIGCQINTLGGMSYKSENLAILHNVSGSVAGINYSVSNGVMSVSGTSSSAGNIDFEFDELPSDTYSILIQIVSGTQSTSSKPSIYVRNASNSYVDYSDNNRRNFSFSNSFKYIRVGWSETSLSLNLSFKIMVIKGSTLPTEFKESFTGIRDSAVTSVVSKNSSNNTIDILTIHSAIQNLDGYGWGINDTCYNYIDFVNKKFVKKVGRVDLGSLEWSYNSNNLLFYAYVNGRKVKTPILSDLYTVRNEDIYVSDASLISNMEITYARNDTRVFLKNSAYTDPIAFKTAMSGVYLYFELATPVETDISAYLTTDTIDVEGGGSLEFTNTYNNDVPSDIDYLIEEVKA